MPLVYRVDPDRQLILAAGCGAVTDESLLDHVEKLRADPEVGCCRRYLVDLRPAEDVELTNEGLRRTAEVLHQPELAEVDFRVAVVPPSEFAFVTFRGYEVYLETREAGGVRRVEVCRTREEAEQFLGLRPS